MQKKKQSKKRWAWTEAQKRKHFTKSNMRCCSGGAPKWFCKTFRKYDKNRCKKALHELIKGADPEDFIFNPKYNESSAKWFWW